MALAGFASLVAIFRRRPEEAWAPRALAGLRFIIELSLCAVLFAIAPFVLSGLGFDEGNIWILSCLSLAVAYAALLYLNYVRSRGISKQGLRHRQPFQALSGLVLGVIIVLLLVLSALDLWVSRGPSIYLLALFYLLIAVANQFLNFVASTRSASGG